MKRIKISISFFLVWFLIIFLDTEKVWPYFVAAAAVHEMGHITAIHVCGGQVLRFQLGAFGGIIRYYLPNRTVRKEFLICVSGCLFGMLLALVSAAVRIPLLCGASTILTIANLLPISYLDGGRALNLLFGEKRVLSLLEYFVITLLLCIGAAAALEWKAYGLLAMLAVPMFLHQTDLHRRKNKGMI